MRHTGGKGGIFPEDIFVGGCQACVDICKYIPDIRIGLYGFDESLKFLRLLFMHGFQSCADSIPAGNIKAALAPAEYPGNGSQVGKTPGTSSPGRPAPDFTLLNGINGSDPFIEFNKTRFLC